eukprot:CAMPEP_0115829628 /NCGR_PEP_ID=MMETSP0287-20121206/1198_1 /TAXON_ID=412157 /ORGANISM="Chrysochromulina rotalis, Strain UIO044" /LENGTH=76 /DNA_ID=CAMNT_0003282903 /DNA_START=261 /DNA_END=491 /DNA_ORIENTATION=+
MTLTTRAIGPGPDSRGLIWHRASISSGQAPVEARGPRRGRSFRPHATACGDPHWLCDWRRSLIIVVRPQAADADHE